MRAEQIEARAQVLLMLAVGGVAACASWTHVVHLAEHYGQRGWLAQAVAACTETMALSGGLELRRRRRIGQPVVAPAIVVVAATALQLAAQIEEAAPGVWGKVVAAVPAISFLTLAKLALSVHTGPVHEPVHVETVHAVVDEPVHAEPVHAAPVHGEPERVVVDVPVHAVDLDVKDDGAVHVFDPASPVMTAIVAPPRARTDAELSEHLLSLGDERPASLRGTARVLRISPDRARRVLAMVGES